jgi:hypothetical protein
VNRSRKNRSFATGSVLPRNKKTLPFVALRFFFFDFSNLALHPMVDSGTLATIEV